MKRQQTPQVCKVPPKWYLRDLRVRPYPRPKLTRYTFTLDPQVGPYIALVHLAKATSFLIAKETIRSILKMIEEDLQWDGTSGVQSRPCITPLKLNKLICNTLMDILDILMQALHNKIAPTISMSTV